MPRHVVRMVAALCGVLTTTMMVSAWSIQTAPSPFTGRWVIEGDPWFDQMASSAAAGRGRAAGAGGAGAAVAGRGGGRGAQAPAPEVILHLQVAPSGAVTGVATGTTGRRGAPGSHPAHDVEITRGGVAGDLLTFQIWRFDGYHNRLHVSARVAGDSLGLEFRRDTPSGPDTFNTRARRVAP